MHRGLTVLLLIGGCLFAGSVFAESVTFTFANGQITGSTTKYYEFDVMITGGSGGTNFGDMQAYINYNTSAFGTSIVGSGKVTVTMGTSLSTNGYYDAPNPNDNTSSKFSIEIGYTTSGPSHTGVSLTTSPTQWAHVKIEIADQDQTAGLSFDQGLMANQCYQDDNATHYSVTATDTDDASLPVELSSFTAEAGPGCVNLTWITESEVDVLGFNIYRGENDSTQLGRINPELVKAAGSSTTRRTYTYTDPRIRTLGTYYYNLESIDVDGTTEMFGPISVTVEQPALPTEFGLSRNYPNPFNPVTKIKYQLPEAAKVVMRIYSLLGDKVRTLIDEEVEAGFHTIQWDATDEAGNQMPSGVYILTMMAGDLRSVQKISLIR